MNEATEYFGVRCEPDRLVETDNGRAIVVVSRKEIQRISLDHGLQAPHPVRQAIVGVLLISVGYFPARHLLDWFLRGGVIVGLELGLIAFAAMGIWILLNALTRGYYLDVQQPDRQQRFTFRPGATREGVEAFVLLIEQQHGLQVERNVGGSFPLD